jgi:putative hemolysin
MPAGRPSGDVGVELLIIAILILLNGVFVAAEIALVTMRRSRLQQLIEEGDRRARRVSRLVSRPGRFLAVIQLGITFIGFLAAAFAGVNIAGALASFLVGLGLGLGPGQASLAALIIVTLALSLVTIIFGELVPKTLALAHAERFALLLSRPVDVLGRVLAPIVWLLTRVTDAVTRVLGAGTVDHDRITPEELRILVERGGEQGLIEAEEEQMIGAVLELGERRVHEVMVPRIGITAVAADVPLGELIDTIVSGGHSRIPVYEETIDNVAGILYAKDLLPYLKGSDHAPDVRTLLRTPLLVPESMSVDDLLHNFQRQKVHIAIVLDEYGGTAGLVTIEDLIEEIVGEIQDEYDTEEPMIEPLSEDEARVDGRTSVDDLMEHFDIDLNGADSEEYDTVGGLVYHEVGGVPKAGDTVEIKGLLSLTVESTDGRRVGKVLAVRQARDVEDGDRDGYGG